MFPKSKQPDRITESDKAPGRLRVTELFRHVVPLIGSDSGVYSSHSCDEDSDVSQSAAW